MRRLFALFFLFAIGCATAANPDKIAAQDLIRSCYRTAEIVLVEGPEYAAIPKVPRRGLGSSRPDRPAACGVRVKFLYRDGGRTTRDDWIVWVGSGHQALDWSSNGDGDNWRRYVRSFAKN
jgi:hypothetical protein